MTVGWKELERRVARALGGKRAVMSGRFGEDRSDVVHPLFGVECKYRQRWEIVSLFEEVREGFAGTGKVPLLALKARRSPLVLVVVRLEDFVDITKRPHRGEKERRDEH